MSFDRVASLEPVRLQMEPARQSQAVMPLVKAAVESEIARLELALEEARQRVKPFETRYGISSERFATDMAAEDLTGRDDEYVQWAGEFILLQRLQTKLQNLRERMRG